MLKTKLYYKDEAYININIFYIYMDMVLNIFGKKLMFIGNINTHKLDKVLIVDYEN